jgi:DNA-binding Lrp family transcriptional regulator
MDRTDISLCLFLMSNSRAPYHELAARLGLSINAVHKRISTLVNQGVIKAFTAHPSLASLGAVSVWVYGRSEAAHPSDVHLRLKADNRTYWVANSGGGYVYVGGYLRGIEELDGYVAFVKREGELADPTIGIVPSMGPHRQEALRPLDYQILASLRKDSRKPATDIAAQVNASVKTVHRRLEWMLEKGLVEFSIDWYPDASNDFVSLCHVDVDQRFDRMTVLDALRKKFSENVLVEMFFSNLPNLLVLFLWTNSMRQMEGLREKVGSVEGVKSETMNVLQVGYMFDTWRDEMVLKEAEPAASRA